MSETLTGYIDHIIFRNDQNGYTVLVLMTEGSEEITCVGYFPDISPGATVCLEGGYTNHASYGKQFQVSAWQEQAPIRWFWGS